MAHDPATPARPPERPLSEGAGSPEPLEWLAPTNKHACGRDPAAGPGTCWWWWSGCTLPAKRGCYIQWTRDQMKRDIAGPTAVQVPHG